MYESLLNYPNSLFGQFERLRRELDDAFGVSGLPSSIRLVRRAPHPVVQACSRQLVKSGPMRHCASARSGGTQEPAADRPEKQEGPDPFGVRASTWGRVGRCASQAPPNAH